MSTSEYDLPHTKQSQIHKLLTAIKNVGRGITHPTFKLRITKN